INELELHDAIIKSTHINYEAKVVEIKMVAYVNSNDASRCPLLMTFSDVESFHEISNFRSLDKNSFAGNVNYWIPAFDKNTTYIYLSDGCLAIQATSIDIRWLDSF
ncbi:MAG: hypothetical protein K2Q15_07930, partial [Burkholderiales bacterium]|nr:hypothetical protein [Burkholderiales bacterium]